MMPRNRHATRTAWRTKTGTPFRGVPVLPRVSGPNCVGKRLVWLTAEFLFTRLLDLASVNSQSLGHAKILASN